MKKFIKENKKLIIGNLIGAVIIITVLLVINYFR